MAVMTWRTFFGLIQGRGIIDALAPLLTRKGVDHQVRRADQTVLHGGRGLDGHQFLHQWRIQTAAKLGEDFGEHKMRLRAIHLDLPDPTGVHHRQVGPQPATDLFVGTGPLMFQQFQRQQDPCRDRWTSTHGGFGEALGERAVYGCDQRRPRKRISPLAEGVRFRDEVPDLQAWSPSGQPMLKISQDLHRRLSSRGGAREPQHTPMQSTSQPPLGRNKLVVTILTMSH
jgi:hypothetical protein